MGKSKKTIDDSYKISTEKETIKKLRGERLKECRKAKGLTQAELEKAMIYGERCVSNIERGERDLSPNFANRASKILGVDPGYLRCETDFKTNEEKIKSETDKVIADVRDMEETLNVLSILENALERLGYKFYPTEKKYAVGYNYHPKDITDEGIALPSSMCMIDNASAKAFLLHLARLIVFEIRDLIREKGSPVSKKKMTQIVTEQWMRESALTLLKESKKDLNESISK